MTAKENISLHQRILTDIADRILSGEWPPGYRIPFEHELMVQYRCSRMTVSKVLTHLVTAGMIERRRKAGSFVSRPHAQSLVLEIADIKTEVAALGLSYSYDVLARGKRKNSKSDRTTLDLKQGAVLEVVVCHYAGRQPFCFEERLINLAAVPEAGDENFAELPPGAWLMSRVPWTAAEHRISATEASAAAAETLKLPPGKPCLVVERKTWSSDHTVTFVRLTYPGNLHELVARFVPEQSDKRMQNSNVSSLRPKPVTTGTSLPADKPTKAPTNSATGSGAPEAPSGQPTARPGVAQRR